jgi:hypothetical protein
VQGIAITNAGGTAAQGHWEYSLDNGQSWLQLGKPSTSTARLLPADDITRVRFLPAANYSNAPGQLNLSYRAWDQTQGTAGGTFNIVKAGGTTAFSDTVETASQFVAPDNDAPVLNTKPFFALPSIPKEKTNSAGFLIKDLILGNVMDVDEGFLLGAAITYANGMNLGEWQYTTDAGKHWHKLESNGDSSAVPLKADDLTRVRLVPNGTTTGTQYFFFRAWDRTEGSVGTTIDVTNKLGGTHAFSTAVQQAYINVT